MRYVIAMGAPWATDVLAKAIGPDPEEWEIVMAWPELLERALRCQPSPRYVFFLNWSEMVSEAVIKAFECCNFHAAPLPYGRGGGPIENMILRGHRTTTITAHRMTSELDAGPIYGTSGPVILNGTKAEIQQRFVAPVAELIRWIVETEPVPKPQEGKPTYFRRLKPSQYTEFWRARG